MIKDGLNFEAKWVTLDDLIRFLMWKTSYLSKQLKLKGAEKFKDFLNYCLLMELPPKGQLMTWTNNRKNDEVVWERLDRCFVNALWFNYFC